jgi:protein-tyrosine phosphatase
MELIMKILFVCLGNICRSPLAEGIARSLSNEHIFDSAGTGHWHIGEPPCEKSQLIAKRKGIDISKLRARQIDSSDLNKWDKIIVMDSQNLEELKKRGFKNVEKLLDIDVPDPYFFDGDRGMDEIYEMIKKGVEKKFNQLQI